MDVEVGESHEDERKLVPVFVDGSGRRWDDDDKDGAG